MRENRFRFFFKIYIMKKIILLFCFLLFGLISLAQTEDFTLATNYDVSNGDTVFRLWEPTTIQSWILTAKWDTLDATDAVLKAQESAYPDATTSQMVDYANMDSLIVDVASGLHYFRDPEGLNGHWVGIELTVNSVTTGTISFYLTIKKLR